MASPRGIHGPDQLLHYWNQVAHTTFDNETSPPTRSRARPRHPGPGRALVVAVILESPAAKGSQMHVAAGDLQSRTYEVVGREPHRFPDADGRRRAARCGAH